MLTLCYLSGAWVEWVSDGKEIMVNQKILEAEW